MGLSTKKQKGNFLELSCGVLMETAYHILKNSEDWFRVVPLWDTSILQYFAIESCTGNGKPWGLGCPRHTRM